MKTLKFNTNINCAGCVASVTPHLNKVSEIEKWDVDTNQSNKPLTVKTDLDEKEIIEIIQKAGFKATINNES